LRVRHCQDTVIKTHYSHKKLRVIELSGLLSARKASASAQNKHLAMPNSDSQDAVMRHDETWKLETEPRLD